METVRLEAFVPSTQRTWASQWRVYESFCHEFVLECLPITSERGHLLSRAEVIRGALGVQDQYFQIKNHSVWTEKLQMPVSYCKGPLCAASSLKYFWWKYPRFPDAPILSDSKGYLVSYKSALGLLKKWTSKAGIDKNVRLHSLR